MPLSGPVTANGTAGSYLVDAWIANDSSVPGVLFQLTNTGGTVTPTETELVLNGSFETVDVGQSSGVADWKLNTGGKGKQDCTKFSDGACSYRLKAKNVTSLKQKIVAPPMEAGDLLRFSASVEGKNAVSSLVSATARREVRQRDEVQRRARDTGRDVLVCEPRAVHGDLGRRQEGHHQADRQSRRRQGLVRRGVGRCGRRRLA
ncbi:MAG: hypothetical protein HND48_12815 [Chloroflexi bacterium]|nr:hypothetical protein [Chloroflexota bacterium]